ncbi:MAG: glycine cleavage system protein GcvH [Nitrospinae bacterium]|nr:glycine cleavage system protein GcvH [Nitrospinota bacterium]
MNFPSNLLYTKEHEWISVDGGKARIGVTDYAQSQLGDIVFVEVPEAGRRLKKQETFGVVESVKTVSDIYSPVGGEVLSVNAGLEAAPELVNQSPYEKGWMIEIRIGDQGELAGLLSAEAYRKYVEEEAGQ